MEMRVNWRKLASPDAPFCFLDRTQYFSKPSALVPDSRDSAPPLPVYSAGARYWNRAAFHESYLYISYISLLCNTVIIVIIIT